jgi:hypothetical protein
VSMVKRRWRRRGRSLGARSVRKLISCSGCPMVVP